MASSTIEQGDSGRLQPIGARNWGTLSILLIMYTVSYLDRNLVALMVDPIKESLGIDDVGVSLIQGLAFALFYGLCGVPMGYLVDRYSRRWVLFGGMIVWSVSAAACGLARSLPQLAVARFGVGAGEATLVPGAYSVITRTFPRNRIAIAIAIFSLGSTLGGALAMTLGGFLVEVTEGWGPVELPLFGRAEPWQQVFIITGLPGVLIAFLALLLPDDVRVPKSTRGAAAPVEPLLPYLRANAGYLALCTASVSIIAVIAYAVASWVPAYLLRTKGIDAAEVGAIVGIPAGIGGAAGFLFAGWLADRLYAKGKRDAHVLPALYGMPAVILLALYGFAITDQPIVIGICAGAIIMLASAGNPLAAHVQMTTPPALRGRIAAVFVLCQHMFGLGIGPVVVAVITEHVFGDPLMVGWSILATVLVLAPIALACLFASRPLARRAMLRAEAEQPAAT